MTVFMSMFVCIFNSSQHKLTFFSLKTCLCGIHHCWINYSLHTFQLAARSLFLRCFWPDHKCTQPHVLTFFFFLQHMSNCPLLWLVLIKVSVVSPEKLIFPGNPSFLPHACTNVLLVHVCMPGQSMFEHSGVAVFQSALAHCP